MRRFALIGCVVMAFLALGIRNTVKMLGAESNDRVQVQERLNGIPDSIGPWRAEDSPLSEKQLRIAEADASLSRIYRHANGYDALNVLVLYGEPGPLGAHTPEICYAGTGYQQQGGAKVHVRPSSDDKFWTSYFGKPNEAAGIQLYWAWRAKDGPWMATDSPRLAFADQSRIYKIYLSRTTFAQDKSEASRVPDAFLSEFLPLLDGVIND